MPGNEGHFAMTWLKRYAVGCLIATLVLGSVDGYYHPGEDMRVGAILLVAAGWPVATAIVVGSTIGEIWHDIRQG
jgi:hypothetical protein